MDADLIQNYKAGKLGLDTVFPYNKYLKKPVKIFNWLKYTYFCLAFNRSSTELALLSCEPIPAAFN